MNQIPLYDFLPLQEAGPDLNEALRQISDGQAALRDILSPLQALKVGEGVPSNDLGSNGNYYFRTDPSGALTYIYHKSGGSWTGIV